jgi:hypothetical protein
MRMCELKYIGNFIKVLFIWPIKELFHDIYFFPEKILREPSIDFDVCNMSSSGDAVDINTNWLLIYFTRIKIYREFYQGIIYMTNKGRHVRIKK